MIQSASSQTLTLPLSLEGRGNPSRRSLSGLLLRELAIWL